jgi:predicted ATP-dependent endonuclease of OLD family
MKIREIRIKNFRSIKEEIIEFPESGILALVGPNNAGKSNILKAINNLLGDSWIVRFSATLNLSLLLENICLDMKILYHTIS